MIFQKNGSARAIWTPLEYKALTEEKTVETVIIYFFSSAQIDLHGKSGK